MEIELIQDGKGVDYNKYRDVIENVKESLFRRNMGKETKEWIKKRYFINMQDYLIYILWLMKKNVIL